MLKLNLKSGKCWAQRKTPEGLAYWKQQPSPNRPKAAFKGPMAMMLADVNGAELEFPDLNNPDEVRVGVKATVNEKPAQGEYQLPDGTILVFEAGICKEIKNIPAKVQARFRREQFQNSLK